MSEFIILGWGGMTAHHILKRIRLELGQAWGTGVHEMLIWNWRKLISGGAVDYSRVKRIYRVEFNACVADGWLEEVSDGCYVITQKFKDFIYSIR